MEPDKLREAAEPVPGPTADAFDPVLEVFKRDIDFTSVGKMVLAEARLPSEATLLW